jgi:hypothetical protein
LLRFCENGFVFSFFLLNSPNFQYYDSWSQRATPCLIPPDFACLLGLEIRNLYAGENILHVGGRAIVVSIAPLKA